MIPKNVITIYSDKHGSKHYLENRKIEEVKGNFLMGAPCPLPDELFREIAGSYMKDNSYHMDFGGMVPEHIIYAHNSLGKTIVIWYRPATERVLNFASQLKIKGSSTVKIPATLAAVHNNELYYFALMTNDRPTATTKLYNAPFFNIYEDGKVCLGTAPVGKVKAKTFQKEAERFENGFFIAEQNHGHNDCCKTSLPKLWAQLIRTKADFPSDKELLPHRHYSTLGSFIKSLKINNSTDEYED